MKVKQCDSPPKRAKRELFIRKPPIAIETEENERIGSIIQFLSSFLNGRVTQDNHMLLNYSTGLQTVRAYNDPDNVTIYGVPLDQRRNCRRAFQKCMHRAGPSTRRSLLCIAAMPGSGKTVMSAINACWFMEETNDEGVAIEVTFNSEQRWERKSIQSSENFSIAVAQRILHRAIERFDKAHAEQMVQSEEVVSALKSLAHPVTSCISVVRRLFSLPADSAVLLCIHGMAATGLSHTAEALSRLANDIDKDQNTFLCVSTKYPDLLVAFTLAADRDLLLQSLGPLWLHESIFDSKVRLLPPVLQPFYTEDVRAILPYRRADVIIIDKLSQLILITSGQPVCLQVLFRQLCDFKMSNITDFCAYVRTNGGTEFVDSLREWFLDIIPDSLPARSKALYGNNSRYGLIREIVSDVSKFTSDPLLLVPDNQSVDLATAVENLCMYTACSFSMPKKSSEVEKLRFVLNAVANDFCHLISSLRDSSQLLVFFPKQVMDRILRKQNDTPTLCSGPLYHLNLCLTRLQENMAMDQYRLGKELEQMAFYSILLYARCNSDFSLSHLCGKYGTDLYSPSLQLLGRQVMKVSVRSLTPTVVQDLCGTLKSNALNGCMIMIENADESPGDCYGLYRKKFGTEFVLLIIQCKDWCRDVPCDANVIAKWRTSSSASFCQDDFALEDQTVVQVVHLLFSAHLPESDITLTQREGIITIDDMRNWLPSVAHSLQFIAHLRKVFFWSTTSQDMYPSIA